MLHAGDLPKTCFIMAPHLSSRRNRTPVLPWSAWTANGRNKIVTRLPS